MQDLNKFVTDHDPEGAYKENCSNFIKMFISHALCVYINFKFSINNHTSSY